MKKKPLTGQYKYNLDTGQVYLVGSKATEFPNLERQASLLKWGEERAKLERGNITPRIGAGGRVDWQRRARGAGVDTLLIWLISEPV